MAIKQNFDMETQLMDILEQKGEPITPAEIAYRLNMPLERIEEDLNTLKKCGIIVETRIEKLIEEGK